MRVPVAGGAVRVYTLPELREVTGAVRARVPPVRRVVGLDAEAAFLYVRTARDQLVAVDLDAARADTVAGGVVRATLGPDGTLYTVDTGRQVVSLARRARFAWPQRLAATPADLFGAGDQRLVSVVREGEPAVLVAAADRPATSRPLPGSGDVVATQWGDLVAVAGDSTVVFVDPVGRRDPAAVPLSGHPRALAFSPSGHRLYVARRSLAGLAVVDRYERRELDGVALPGSAATLRLDPFGRWLIARPASGDSVWVVDLPVKRFVGGLAASWSADLPTVGPDGTLLVRQGDAVAAYRGDSLARTGRVRGAGDDLWIVTTWSPAGRAGEPAAQAATAAGEADGRFYVQVSVSQNQAWSAEMVQQLTRAGLAASVLAPTRPDEGYRVVLGPYETRGQAESIGRKLGRPFWIYQPGQ